MLIARAQLRSRVVPVFFGRSERATAVLPEFVSYFLNVVVSELNDRVRAVRVQHLLGVLVGLLRVLQCLPGHLLARFMFLFVMLLGGGAVRMSSDNMQFRGLLMIFVMRSIVIALRHYALWTPTDHAGFAK